MRHEIRELRPEDYDAVRALWEACPGVGLSPDDTREGVSRFLADNPALSFLAESDGHCIGAVLCGHDGRRGYPHHLAVAESARRQGLGRSLVDRAAAALRAIGIPKLHVLVFAVNELGARFWRKERAEERTDLRAFSRMTGE